MSTVNFNRNIDSKNTIIQSLYLITILTFSSIIKNIPKELKAINSRMIAFHVYFAIKHSSQEDFRKWRCSPNDNERGKVEVRAGALCTKFLDCRSTTF